MKGLRTALKNTVAIAKRDKFGRADMPEAFPGLRVEVRQVIPRRPGYYPWVVKLFKDDVLICKRALKQQAYDWMVLEAAITGEKLPY